jgi:type I restriction enzyme S subunit
MGSDWKTYKLESLASSDKSAMSTGPFGSAISSKFFQPSGVPVIRGGNLSANTSKRMSDDGLVFVSSEKATEFGRSIVKNGDLLFTCWGTINQVGLITSTLKYSEYIISNKQMKITLDQSKALPLFLYYIFSGPYKQAEILRNGIGAAVPGFNLGQLKGHFVSLPDLKEQKLIANFINGFDQKIELNRETNKTLEQMATTLFKSWFVDFEPVFDNLLANADFDLTKLPSDFPLVLQKRAQKRLLVLNSEVGEVTKLKAKANAEVNAKASLKTSLENDSTENIHQHFPSEFEHYEKLGWVPKGWQESNVGSEFDVTMGQSPPGSTYNEIYEGIPFFQGKTDYGFRFPSNRIYCTAPKRLANKNDTLVSVRAPVGTINLAAEKCAIGRGLAAVRHKSGSISFTYYAMNDLAKHFAVFEGEGTVFGSINQKDFNALPQLSTPAELANLFNQFCSSWDEKIELTSLQINELTKLRDTLLPKLISGELQIS